MKKSTLKMFVISKVLEFYPNCHGYEFCCEGKSYNSCYTNLHSGGELLPFFKKQRKVALEIQNNLLLDHWYSFIKNITLQVIFVASTQYRYYDNM